MEGITAKLEKEQKKVTGIELQLEKFGRFNLNN